MPTAAIESAQGKSKDPPDHKVEWRVDDALHTLMRAGEIIQDKKMMAAVRKRASKKADEHRDMAKRAGELAKQGKISPKAMERLAGK